MNDMSMGWRWYDLKTKHYNSTLGNLSNIIQNDHLLARLQYMVI